MLNGAEGLSQVATGLVSQGMAIFDALRGEVIDYDDEDDAAPLAGPELRDSRRARHAVGCQRAGKRRIESPADVSR